MSKKASLITYSYKKTKNSQSNVKIGKEKQPSTSSHLEDNELKKLKDFDLNWEYGPSMGITRLERWNRAEKHGLNPSAEVKQLVMENSNNERYTQCLWNEYKNIM